MGLTKSESFVVERKYVSEHAFAYYGEGFFKFLNMKIELKRPLIFFDLETTGLSITQDKIVEISVTKVSPDGEPITKTRLINPGIPISEEATAVHGISDDDVKDAPKFEEVAKSMSKFFEGCDVAGYNILKFDVPMLSEHFLKLGIEWPAKDTKFVDVYNLVCKVFPRNLSDVYKIVTGNEAKEAHNADYDNMMTMEVLAGMINLRSYIVTPFAKLSRTVEELHQQSIEGRGKYADFAGKISIGKSGEYLYNFGKHKGELVTKYVNFAKWMLVNDFPENTKRVVEQIIKREVK